eukprot:Ihof_evm4s258 gene=Ihof_evmTU4s258
MNGEDQEEVLVNAMQSCLQSLDNIPHLANDLVMLMRIMGLISLGFPLTGKSLAACAVKHNAIFLLDNETKGGTRYSLVHYVPDGSGHRRHKRAAATNETKVDYRLSRGTKRRGGECGSGTETNKKSKQTANGYMHCKEEIQSSSEKEMTEEENISQPSQEMATDDEIDYMAMPKHDLFTCLPSIAVRTISGSKAHLPKTGMMVCPGDVKIYVLCDCCGAIFTRNGWMVHSCTSTARPWAHIGIVKESSTLDRMFGPSHLGLPSYIRTHGSMASSLRNVIRIKMKTPQPCDSKDSQPDSPSQSKSLTSDSDNELLGDKARRKARRKEKKKCSDRNIWLGPGWEVPSLAPQEEIPKDRILWDCYQRPVVLGYSAEMGYHYNGTRHSRVKVEKTYMEDKLLIRQNIKDKYLILVLVDGHNGDQASLFFAEQAMTRVEKLLQDGDSSGQGWSFEDLSKQEEFRAQVVAIYKALDLEYLAAKRAAFSAWAQAHPDLCADNASTDYSCNTSRWASCTLDIKPPPHPTDHGLNCPNGQAKQAGSSGSAHHDSQGNHDIKGMTKMKGVGKDVEPEPNHITKDNIIPSAKPSQSDPTTYQSQTIPEAIDSHDNPPVPAHPSPPVTSSESDSVAPHSLVQGEDRERSLVQPTMQTALRPSVDMGSPIEVPSSPLPSSLPVSPPCTAIGAGDLVGANGNNIQASCPAASLSPQHPPTARQGGLRVVLGQGIAVLFPTEQEHTVSESPPATSPVPLQPGDNSCVEVHCDQPDDVTATLPLAGSGSPTRPLPDDLVKPSVEGPVPMMDLPDTLGYSKRKEELDINMQEEKKDKGGGGEERTDDIEKDYTSLSGMHRKGQAIGSPTIDGPTQPHLHSEEAPTLHPTAPYNDTSDMLHPEKEGDQRDVPVKLEIEDAGGCTAGPDTALKEDHWNFPTRKVTQDDDDPTGKGDGEEGDPLQPTNEVASHPDVTMTTGLPRRSRIEEDLIQILISANIEVTTPLRLPKQYPTTRKGRKAYSKLYHYLRRRESMSAKKSSKPSHVPPPCKKTIIKPQKPIKAPVKKPAVTIPPPQPPPIATHRRHTTHYCPQAEGPFPQSASGSTTILSLPEARDYKPCQHEAPMDDGCTLVINVLYKGWVVNCNVGDSRTLIASRPVNSFRWNTLFASDDQGLHRPELVEQIMANGGQFVDDRTGKVKTFRVPQPYYHFLRRCRVRPLPANAINNIGVPTQRALNLGASMGDLLFKLQPERPILCSVPAVRFVLMPEEGKCMMLMASDGLFNYLPDHLSTDKQQNEFLTH